MNTIDSIKQRRSIREFLDKLIPQAALEAIVDCARFAPTARNVQPWEFVVVTDKAMLERIAQITDHGKFISRAAACVLVFSQDTKYYLEDCCAATQNAMLAAAALGIGSCWVAGDKKPYSAMFYELLKVPQHCKLVSLIALGYPLDKKEFREIDKRPLAEVLHWEEF